MKHIAWAISNLTRGSPLPKYEMIKDSIPILCDLIKREVIYDDNDILSDVCWSISYGSESKRDKIQLVINTGVIPKMIEMLETEFLPILVPCMRVVGNVSTGSAEQTQ